jgi:hypothetical protein
VDVPAEVTRLAGRRAAARARRDYAAADALRDELAALGWDVTDAPDGPLLAPRPAFPVHADVRELPAAAGPRPGVVVSLLVQGWPADVQRCAGALLRHLPPEVRLVGLDLGDVDGAGSALHRLAAGSGGRLTDLHVAADPGWGAARAALLRTCPEEVHVLLDTSTVLEGDAVGPLVEALDDPGVVAAGWRGADVDLADDWRSFVDAGPGQVDALLGYLLAVRRSAALAAGVPDPRARCYRNADLEMGLALRERGGRLVVPPGRLPVRQERHRGYHDTDPEVLERESRRTYDRLLRRFRGRADLLAPRT